MPIVSDPSQAFRSPPVPRAAIPPGEGARFAALTGAVTPLTEHVARRHLSMAWTERFGAPPSERTLAIVLAQWALETGRGQQMRGYNFGGLKADARTSHFAVLSTTEGASAEARRVRCRFRTYADAPAGARDYVATLAAEYPEAVAAAMKGKASDFVDALERRRYFTADSGAYKSAIVSLSREYAEGPGKLVVTGPAELVDGVINAFQRAILRRA